MTPDPIDFAVGRLIAQHRNRIGLSQQALGEAVGLSHQQIRKYETGANRVAAATLVALGRALNCPTSELLPPTASEAPPASDVGRMLNPQSRHLLVSYQQIAPELRRALMNIARRLAQLA